MRDGVEQLCNGTGVGSAEHLVSDADFDGMNNASSEPGDLTPPHAKYTTDHYKHWDPQSPATPENPSEPFTGDFSIYDSFQLVMGDVKVKIEDIPKHGVRLDDYWVHQVTNTNMPFEDRARYWPAEFNDQGKIRRWRVPLGLPAMRSGRWVGGPYEWWNDHELCGEAARASFKHPELVYFGWEDVCHECVAFEEERAAKEEHTREERVQERGG